MNINENCVVTYLYENLILSDNNCILVAEYENKKAISLYQKNKFKNTKSIMTVEL